MSKKVDLYEIGEKSRMWLAEIGITKREDFLLFTPEEIYQKLVLEKETGNSIVKNLAKPLLYALRANRHYIETDEKIPWNFWKKVNE